MYESLSSSYTYYIPPEVAPFYFAENFLPDAEVSIGVEVNEKMIVTSVYKNSSAANAGILRGDSVIAIDGNPVVNKGAFDKLASGEEGDELSLTVYRSGIEITVKLNFAKVVLPTVFLDSVENIPKIRITGFEQNLTANEFREALELTKGATSTIIDLRGNPGGNIDELLNVAELFLNKGDTILFVDYTDYEEGSDSQLLLRDLITASETGLGADRYYVFLVNSNTASCSEYLLAAVTANKKSPLIGSPTYGKGIGVYVMETNLHGISSIESMLFYDKFGETFHAKGFVPDYAATNEVEIFNKALEFIEVRQQREAGYGVYNNSKFLKKSYTKSFEKIGAYKWIK